MHDSDKPSTNRVETLDLYEPKILVTEIHFTHSLVCLCVCLSLLSSPLPARLSCLYLTSLSLSSLKSENIPTSPTPIEKTVSRYCDCGMQLLSYGVCRYGLLVKWHPQLPVTIVSATTSQKDDQDDSGKSRVRKSVDSECKSLKTYIKNSCCVRCIRLWLERNFKRFFNMNILYLLFVGVLK